MLDLNLEVINIINVMMLVSFKESLTVAVVIIVVLFSIIWLTKIRKAVINKI